MKHKVNSRSVVTHMVNNIRSTGACLEFFIGWPRLNGRKSRLKAESGVEFLGRGQHYITLHYITLNFLQWPK